MFGRKLSVVTSATLFLEVGRKPVLRFGLVLMVSALLALTVVTSSPASAAGITHPSAPRDVTATAGDNKAFIRFASPSSTGGSRVTGYYVEEYGRRSAIRRCASTRCTVLGLSNGVHYRFAVAATNRFGRSAYSTPSNAVSPTATTGPASMITFDANGGAGMMASETEPFDSTTTLTLNLFTYTGYSFNGWNSEASGDGSTFTNGELVKFNGSTTLYAQWTLGPPTWTVAFSANGGSGTMPSETEGASTALAFNTFTRAGYTFNDWNTAANGSGTSYANGAAYAFISSVVLYAQWNTASPTVLFTGTTTSNWSGYVLPTTSLDTEATGEWTVPTLNCTDTLDGSSSTWVGIGGNTWSDGTSSGALLQTGIEDDCVSGVQMNSGWFEILPSSPNYAETFSNFPVYPGDTIEAIVGYVNGRWATDIEDLSTGLSGVFLVGDGWEVVTTSTFASVGGLQGFATETSYSGAYSAEWIEEDVTSADSGSLFSLPNYGSVTFFNLRTNLSSWSLSDDDAVEIMNGKNAVVSVPGPVVNDGFTVTYKGP
jgi:hypothetical protein